MPGAGSLGPPPAKRFNHDKLGVALYVTKKKANYRQFSDTLAVYTLKEFCDSKAQQGNQVTVQKGSRANCHCLSCR
eukprot:9521972-Alexandrium_andersonii.AAC.1